MGNVTGNVVAHTKQKKKKQLCYLGREKKEKNAT